MRHFTHRLKARFALRVHFTGFLASLALIGILASRALQSAGVGSVPLRTALVHPLLYACFFGLVRIWLGWLFDRHADDLRLDNPDLKRVGDEKRRSSGEAGGGWDFPDLGFEDGIEGLLILIAVILVALLGYWIVSEGALILCDVIFEVALGASLLKATRRAIPEDGDWSGRLIRATAPPFVAFWALSVAGTTYLAHRCPTMTRLSQAPIACRAASEAP